jgi:outer membrane immunogenic protein
MKRFLLGGAVAIFGTASAFATDLPAKAPAYKATPAYNWAGFYIGAHTGYGWGDYKMADPFGPVTGHLDPKGWLGGFQLGYNEYIAPNWVLGSEIDFSWGDIKDDGPSSPAIALLSTKTDFMGTARARLGYAFDRTLIYATGGLAWAHVKSTEFALLVNQFAPDTYHLGWTAGGGLEYALDPRWSVKVEYLYSDLGHYTQAVNGTSRRESLTLNTVRAGLNYRFGDSAPAASAMPVKARPAAWTWNGSYIGAHAGYGWGKFHEDDPVFTVTTDLKPSGWFGGFQTGYNWQFAPNWLFGIETDNSFGSVKDNGTASPIAFTAVSKIDQFGTVRARLGYVVDRSLLYATGGFAWAHLKFDKSTNTTNWDTYEGGWTVGGGWEYAIDAKWSAKIEYLYADFGHRSDSHGLAAAPLGTKLTMNTVKAGLNYKFDLADLLHGR